MMQNRPRRSAAVVLSAAVLFVGVTACGTQGGESDSRANPKPDKSSEAAPLSAPIVLTKTGGFAGVHEEVTVNLGGKAVLTTKGEKPFTCKVDPATLVSLTEEAGFLKTNGVKEKSKGLPSDPPIHDAFNYFLIIDGEEFRYTEGRKIPEAVQPVLAAMSDVLDSGKALRDGREHPNGTPACTT